MSMKGLLSLLFLSLLLCQFDLIASSTFNCQSPFEMWQLKFFLLVQICCHKPVSVDIVLDIVLLPSVF